MTVTVVAILDFKNGVLQHLTLLVMTI